MKRQRRRGVYIDPMWLFFILVGIALGMMIQMLRTAQAKEEQPRTVVVVQDKTESAESREPVEMVASRVFYTEAKEPEEKTYERGTDGDLDLLALVIYQEAGGDDCSNETRQMVGEVALNRVADDRYPDTLHGVLTQRSQYGRLHWTGIQWPDRAENPGEQEAVQRAYRIAEDLLVDDCDRLLPEDVIYQAEFEQGTEIVAEAPGFYFCR